VNGNLPWNEHKKQIQLLGASDLMGNQQQYATICCCSLLNYKYCKKKKISDMEI